MEAMIENQREQLISYHLLLQKKLNQKGGGCSFPFCDGRGNTDERWKTHSCEKTCPLKKKYPEDQVENLLLLVIISKHTIPI